VELRPEIQLKQTQKLVMTPQLQQAIKMLQLSNLELSQRIEEELIENPALEMEDRDERTGNELTEEEILEHMERTREEKVVDDFNEELLIDQRSYPQSAPEGEDRKREFIEGALSRDMTLKEYLMRQISLLKIQPEDLEVAEVLISFINDAGYLSETIENISSEFSISTQRLDAVLNIIQTLDPPGIGARSIQECLIIQLRNRGHYPIAEKLVLDHLNRIKLRKYDEIAKKTHISKANLKDALALISSLEPYPGRQFNSEEVRYIIPDVIIEKREGVFVVITNDLGIPKLRVNRYFEYLLKKKDSERRVKDFVSDRVQRARTFIHSVQQRESTLLRVSKAILERQIDFFEKGPLHLRPLTLRDIAEMVDLHESTISRITSSKYAQTPYGVFRMKYFFSNPIQAKGRQDFSSTSIREIIKEIVQNEGSKNHLSDQKIAELLQKRGIKIARRTVAKYRKELHILPSNLRR